MKALNHWKHWQIFVGTTGLIFVLYIAFLVIGISLAVNDPDLESNPEALFSYFKFLPFILMPSIILIFLWYYSIGSGLHRYLPSGVKMNVKLFRIFMSVPIIYFLFLMFVMSFIFSNVGESIATNRPPHFIMTPAFPIILFLIIILHFFSIFCIFYSFYFNAKTLKSIILKREALFSDYVGEFFLLWFHFVGVWIIQPKVNKIVSEVKSTEADRSVID